MAVITPIKPLINKNLGRTRVSSARQTVNKVSDILKKNSKEKSNIFSKKSNFRRKRVEYEKRAQLEDQLEASKVGTVLFSPLRTAQAVGGGIFKRIINFIAYLGAGWIIRNAPTWIAMGKEFIARIQVTGQILSGFVSNVTNLFLGFGNLLGAIGQNIVKFDLFDSTNRVSGAFDELLGTIDNMGSQIEEAFRVFTTPLTEPTYSKENIPPVGSQAPEGLYERPESGGAISGAYDIASKIGANKDQWDIYRNTLAQIESGGRYDIAGGSGKFYDGRYQMGAEAKTDAARILGIPNPGHSNNPNDPKRVSFRKNKELQEKMFAAYTLANHGYLSSNRTYQGKPTVEQKLQILGYAHNQGAGGAASWLKTGRVGRDGFGTAGTKYTDALARNFRGRVNPYPDQKIQESSISSRQPQSIPSQSSLPALPPTNTLGGGVQAYGAWRRGGRKHAGVDFDISGNQKFYSRIGGNVTKIGYDPGGYGNYIDIFNSQLGVYERIAEAARVLVKRGDTIQPGEAVVQGESNTGVIHYEIRKNSGYGFEGTLNPLQFLTNKKSQIASQPQISAPSSAPSALQEPEALTLEREGQTVFFIDQILPPSPQQVSPTSGPSMPSLEGSQINQIDLLNNFIKNKFLLDLAYL